MKTYLVYINGALTSRIIKAASHNAAEKKAKKLYPSDNVSVAYTEV